jgi:excisionase family DNA binding protein
VVTSTVLTVDEAAVVLKVSRATIYNWLRTGRIAGVQPAGPGGRYVIPQDVIERLLAAA